MKTNCFHPREEGGKTASRGFVLPFPLIHLATFPNLLYPDQGPVGQAAAWETTAILTPIHVHGESLPHPEFIERTQWIRLPNTVLFPASSAPVFHLAAHCCYQAHRVSEPIIIMLTIHYSGHCDALWMLTHSAWGQPTLTSIPLEARRRAPVPSFNEVWMGTCASNQWMW